MKVIHERYPSIVALLPDIMYKLDTGGKFIYLNDSVRNLGYEPDELIDRHFSVIIHPDDLEDIQRSVALEKMTRGGNTAGPPKLFDERRTGKRITRNLFVRLVPKNRRAGNGGTPAPQCEVIATGSYDPAMFDAGKHFNGTLGLIRRVGGAETMDENMARYLEHYRSLVENTGDVISILATDGTVLFASPSVYRVLELEPDVFIGENMLDYIHADDISDVVKACAGSNPQEPEIEFTCRMRRPGTPWRIMNSSGTLIHDSHGNAMCILLNSRDITSQREAEASMRIAMEYMEQRVIERTAVLDRVNRKLGEEMENRKRDEARLMESEIKYRTLADNIDDIVLDLDPYGVIIIVNSAMERISGRRAADMISHNIIEYLNGDDIPGFLDSIGPDCLAASPGKKTAAEVCVMNELRLIRKDSSQVWLDMRCRPVRDDSGTVRGFRGVAIDVTRRKKSEEEQVLASKIESIGNFAGGIAHDFNNLLAGILGNIALVKQKMSEDDEKFRQLAQAEQASQMIRNLTIRLLDFSSRGEPVIMSSQLQQIVREAAALALGDSAIECRYFVRGRVKNADVDPEQIGRVIHNILLNARQAMHGAGKVEISLENEAVEAGSGIPLKAGKYVKISIADSGPGIPDGIIKNIFDPYFTTKENGSGLGLSICYSIMKKHRGHIAVESAEGKGTTFSLYLPASKKNAPR